MKLTVDDINLILKSPYKEPLEALLKIVKLNNRELELIDLYYFQGLKQREVALKFAIEERTLRSQLLKLKKKLLKVWDGNSVAIALANQLKQP